MKLRLSFWLIILLSYCGSFIDAMFRSSWMSEKPVSVKAEFPEYTDPSSSHYIKPQLSPSVMNAAQKSQYNSIAAEALSSKSSKSSNYSAPAEQNNSSMHNSSLEVKNQGSLLSQLVWGGKKFELPSAVAEKSSASESKSSTAPSVGSSVVDMQRNNAQQILQVEQVVPRDIAQGVSLEKVAFSEKVSDKLPVEDGSRSQGPRSNPLLDAIKNKPKLKNKAAVDDNIVQPKTNSYTQQEYFVERAKIQDIAEQNALKSINKDVANQLKQQWPNILSEYTAKRQGMDIPQSRIDALKIKTQDQMLKDAIVKNKAAIDATVAESLKEFESTAIIVKPKMTGAKNVNIAQSSQENIRIQAEGVMKKSIEQKIDESFMQQELIMREDYGLDHPNASQPEIIAAINKEIAPLKSQAYLDVLVKNRDAIKRAGQDAVAAWQAKQQAQVVKSSNSAGRNPSPVTVVTISN